MRVLLLCSAVFLAAAGGWWGTSALRADAACVHKPNANCLIETAVRAGNRAPPKDRSSVVRSLAAVGRFEDAAEVLKRIGDERERNSDADELLARRLAWEASREPDRVVDFAPLDALATRPEAATYSGGPRSRAHAYGTLALYLCEARHHAAGARPSLWPRPPHSRQQSPSYPNATLNEMLRRWPDVIGAVGGDNVLYLWERYAKALHCAGRPGEAMALLHRLESEAAGEERRLPGIFYTWMDWRLSAEAEALALRTSERLRATFLSKVVQRALDEGRNDRAAELAGALVPAAVEGTTKPEPLGLRLEAIRLAVRAHRLTGAVDRGLQAAEAALALARNPPNGLAGFKPFNLADVAGIYNDLGRAKEAEAVIREALGARPDDDTIIGFGFVAGAVSYGRWGLGDELTTELLVELWRAGQTEAATASLRGLQAPDPSYRYRGWSGIYRAAAESGRRDFGAGDFPAEVPTALWPSLAAELAAFHLDRGEPQAAEAWTSSAIGRGLGTTKLARVAALLDRPDLVRSALEQAPSNVGAEPLRQVLAFTEIAVAFNELLGQPLSPAHR